MSNNFDIVNQHKLKVTCDIKTNAFKNLKCETFYHFLIPNIFKTKVYLINEVDPCNLNM